MIIQKIVYLIVAALVGFIFNMLNIPAGWLIGSLLTGVFCGVFIKRYKFDGKPFKIALAFVGSNISLLLMIDTLKHIHHLILPLFITIVIVLIAGLIFGGFLHKTVDGVSQTTAFFCCIPGGASEIIGISSQYGADERLVAAFHTVRITFFTIAIPLIVALLHPVTDQFVREHENFTLTINHIYFFVVVIIFTIVLDRIIKVPGGTLLFSILIGFLLSEFIIAVEHVPRYISGIGQAMIGAFVGIRFDKEVLVRLLKVGPTALLIVMMFFCLSLVTAAIFMFVTGQPYATSLISTVPAGAAEMSVTAVALNVNPTIVASLHITRVIVLFLLLPVLMKVFRKMNESIKKRNL